MFWLAYDLGFAAGFSGGVMFVCGAIVLLLALAFVLYRASDGWSKW